jgi:hypothetical protein
LRREKLRYRLEFYPILAIYLAQIGFLALTNGCEGNLLIKTSSFAGLISQNIVR